MNEPHPNRLIRIARKGSLSSSLWVFGLATTLLLVGIWGRAVTYDEPTVRETARAVVDSGVASERIYGWISDAVSTSTGADSEVAEHVLDDLKGRSEVDVAVATIVDQFVAALFSSESSDVVIDVGSSLDPLVPLVVLSLADQDVDVDEEAVLSAIGSAQDIGLETSEVRTVKNVVERTRAALSIIVLVSAAALLVSGSVALWLSGDWLVMARSLATRVVMSALSFAVLFRIGAWALDPERGGGPISNAGGIILGSNAAVFIVVAFAMALLAASIAVIVRQRPSVPSEVVEDDVTASTGELVSV